MKTPDAIRTFPWHPTNYLRWNNGVLEQKMRRKTKIFPAQGPAYMGGYEYEWQPIPEFKG